MQSDTSVVMILVEKHCVGIGARTRGLRRSIYHTELGID